MSLCFWKNRKFYSCYVLGYSHLFSVVMIEEIASPTGFSNGLVVNGNEKHRQVTYKTKNYRNFREGS